MLTLAFDTATVSGRFALADAAGVLAGRRHNVAGSYADALLPVVGEMLADADRDLTEITTVGVTTGPGSFTGVRIGVATAKALAYALDARLVAVSTLAAMAAALLAEQPDADLAVPVLDARRGEIFAAVYRRAGGWVTPVAEPAAQPPDTWWQRLRDLVVDVETPVFGGDGVALLVGGQSELRAELAARGTPIRRVWSSAQPGTAEVLAAALADRNVDLPPVHPFSLVPLYLRVSDAEVKRNIDLTPLYTRSQYSRHRSGPDAAGAATGASDEPEQS